jgi:hypothetical protein
VTGSVEDESGTVLLGVGADGVATLTLNRPHRHNAFLQKRPPRFPPLAGDMRPAAITGAELPR